MKTILILTIAICNSILNAAPVAERVSSEFTDRECQYYDRIINYLNAEEIIPKVQWKALYTLRGCVHEYRREFTNNPNGSASSCKNTRKLVAKMNELYSILKKRKPDMDDQSLVECSKCKHGFTQINGGAFPIVCKHCVLGYVKPIKIIINPMDADEYNK